MREHTKTFQFGDKQIEFSTGKLANLAAGSLLLKMGGTTVLTTVAVDKSDSKLDFFPLSVEYIEKMYARGAISGSRFQKREGFPSEEAIIKARQVDHSIRSLFPKSFRKPVTVVITIFSYDGINDPETLAVLGASTALMMSGVPYFGPSSSVVACVDENNKVVINPDAQGRENNKAEFLISGLDDKFLNIEGWGKEVEEEVMSNVLDESMKAIKIFNGFQNEFIKDLEIVNPIAELMESDDYDLPAPEALITMVKEKKYDAIKDSLFQPEKADRAILISTIKTDLLTEIEKAEGEYSELDINNAIEYIARKILREEIMKNGKRRLERGLEEIRPLVAEVDLLPTVHGSAMFMRGLTQSLSIVTLGSKAMGQMLDEMEGESTKNFMHHYNMPGFSTGEAKRYDYKPGRREIGHGAIGENALKHMIPSQEKFPYTIRVVSEILTSNGSTSMAATCASSMALMAAGVPLKEAVAGIGVGLITENPNQENYKLILDIEGIEDFYGDMDFKVTGTKNGITAIQYENKLRGVKPEILKEAFQLAKKGRGEVLAVMNSAINAPRESVSPNAPVVDTLKIKQDRIGELIGPGGKNIKELVQVSEERFSKPVDINIEDDGTVFITASNKEQLDFVVNTINQMFEEAEEGKLYRGRVDKIMPYGMFVDVSSSISGLCHISEISATNKNPNLTAIFHEGDEVNVKVLKLEGGKVNFTMVGVNQANPEMQTKMDNEKSTETYQRTERNDRGGDRRFDRRR